MIVSSVNVRLYRERGAIGAATSYGPTEGPLDESREFLGLGRIIEAHANPYTGRTVPRKIVGPVAVAKDLREFIAVEVSQ